MHVLVRMEDITVVVVDIVLILLTSVVDIVLILLTSVVDIV